MTSSDDQNKKKQKLADDPLESEEGTNISTASIQSDFEEESKQSGESDSSYMLLSDEEDLLNDEYGLEDSGETLEYFKSSSSTEQESASEVAWVDSEDQDIYKEEQSATWLKPSENEKTLNREVKKIAFKYLKNIFTAKCKIKVFKAFKDFKILIDSFNLIYFIFDLDGDQRYKTFKIELYKITDVCCFNNRILFYSNTSSFIKEVTQDGIVTDIKKDMGNIHKMVEYSGSLYVIGDKLYMLNSSMFIKNEFNGKFTDICCANETVLCLNEAGDIFVFDLELNFKEKLCFSYRFQFKSIYSVRECVFIAKDDGIIVLDKDLKEIKEYSNLTGPLTALAYNNNFIFHGSDYQNSFKILKNDLTYYDKFPYAKIKINGIAAMDTDNDTVYFAESKFISSIKINYV